MSRKIKCVIIDDELNAITVLKKKIARFFPPLEIVATFNDPNQVVEEHNDIVFDLLFLDIEMPNYNGFQLLDELKPHHKFETIFVTAYNNYAVEAFQQHAMGYILKPVDNDDFVRTVSLSLIRIASESGGTSKSAIDIYNQPNFKVAIPHKGELVLVDLSDILFAEADGSYTHIHTQNNQYLISKNLKYTESELFDFRFIRVNRSFLVNPYAIKTVSKKSLASIQLVNGVDIPVSSRIKDEVFQELSHFIKNIN
jgi:two-component system LytT family response regulator